MRYIERKAGIFFLRQPRIPLLPLAAAPRVYASARHSVCVLLCWFRRQRRFSNLLGVRLQLLWRNSVSFSFTKNHRQETFVYSRQYSFLLSCTKKRRRCDICSLFWPSPPRLSSSAARTPRSRGRQLHKHACSCLPVVAERAAGCRNGIILKRPAKAKRNLLFAFITAYTHDERFDRKQWRFIATQTHACALLQMAHPSDGSNSRPSTMLFRPKHNVQVENGGSGFGFQSRNDCHRRICKRFAMFAARNAPEDAGFSFFRSNVSAMRG